MRLHKTPKIPAIASLSSPQFDAKAISAESRDEPGLPCMSGLAASRRDGAGAATMESCPTFESALPDANCPEPSFDDGPE
jgi:hypothetical protein